MEHRTRIVQYLVAASVSLASMTLGVSSSWPTTVIVYFNSTHTDIDVSDEDISWMLAMASPGFMAGSLFTSFVSDKYGRRTTILSSTVPMALGTMMLLLFLKAWVLYVARFLWGWGTGMIGTVVSMYLSEIADKDLRATLSVGTRFMFNLGSLFTISLGPFITYQTLNLSLLILPIIYFAACWWIPESPYFYLKVGKVEQAGKELSKLRNYKDQKELEDEFLVLQSSVNTDMRRKTSVRELFTGAQYRKAIIISAGLKFTQIMSGVVTVQNYLGRIMLDSLSYISLPTVLIVFGVVRFLVGLISPVLADQVGRRPLLIYSYFGTAVSHFITGAYFFCQEVLGIDQLLLSPYGFIPFIGILGSNIVSTLGFTSIVFVIPAELFPMNIKAVAMSSLSIYGGLLGFIIAKGYQKVKDLVGYCGVFWILATIALTGSIFSIIFVPETKGKTLKEIQVMLQGDLYEEGDGKLGKVEIECSIDNELQELNKKEVSRL